jgi:hypothetical protein
VQVAGKRVGGQRRIDRTLVVRVVITGDHHHRHPCARNLAHRKLKRLVGHATRIKQVADD